ncbi:uncharacterized protein LOC123315776 [Coccinella septempunctata]|uniref:uncharacterized protein LOC123315776 n=1 Tax=Coccinella septempunctata TaxID=41139 RepID=UPI001D0747DF|nr:uncharacterized protein LOC123315776 [Coccinella septempunctata]
MMSEKEKTFDELIDRKRLISLVEQRPALWNKFLDIYKDKTARTEAWREICMILNTNFEGMKEEEKQVFGRCVIKRWTQIRDAWVKTINSQRILKKSAPVRSYRYHKQLSFLQEVVQADENAQNIAKKRSPSQLNVPTENNGESVEVDQNEPYNQNENDETEDNQATTETYKTRSIPPNKKKKTVNILDEKMISFIDHELKLSKEKMNEDRNLSFFKSILPSLKLFDDDQTLEFQSGVINLVQTIKRRANSWSQSSSRYQNDYQGYSNRQDFMESPSEASTSTQRDQMQSPTATSSIPENVKPEIIEWDQDLEM